MGQLLRILREHDIRYFFYIGGNDSMDTVAKLSAYAEAHGYEMRVIGVPKTIDNDLEGTDHTPGYGSAAKYIAVTVQEILRDTAVYTAPAVTVVEIMGRGAGWLTAAASLGRRVMDSEPDLVYLPERPFRFEEFYEDVADALQKHPNVVVAVSEGPSSRTDGMSASRRRAARSMRSGTNISPGQARHWSWRFGRNSGARCVRWSGTCRSAVPRIRHRRRTSRIACSRRRRSARRRCGHQPGDDDHPAHIRPAVCLCH